MEYEPQSWGPGKGDIFSIMSEPIWKRYISTYAIYKKGAVTEPQRHLLSIIYKRDPPLLNKWMKLNMAYVTRCLEWDPIIYSVCIHETVII